MNTIPDRIPQRHMYTRLQHDWGRLSGSRCALDRARSWQLPIGPIADLDDLLVLTGYGRVAGCGAEHDQLLGSLVELARDDDLAARVVLQRILPGLWSLAKRRSRLRHPDGVAAVHDEDDDVLATAWTVIRSFRLDHRRDHVAARMLKEVEYRAFRLPHRRRARFVPTSGEHLDRPVELDPLGGARGELELVLWTARRRGLAAADAAELRAWGAGVEASSLAGAREVTDRTVRNQRAASLRRVRALVGA